LRASKRKFDFEPVTLEELATNKTMAFAWDAQTYDVYSGIYKDLPDSKRLQGRLDKVFERRSLHGFADMHAGRLAVENDERARSLLLHPRAVAFIHGEIHASRLGGGIQTTYRTLLPSKSDATQFVQIINEVTKHGLGITKDLYVIEANSDGRVVKLDDPDNNLSADQKEEVINVYTDVKNEFPGAQSLCISGKLSLKHTHTHTYTHTHISIYTRIQTHT